VAARRDSMMRPRVWSRGVRSRRARALHDVARLGAPERVAGWLAELAPATDADVVALFAAHASALAGADGSRLSLWAPASGPTWAPASGPQSALGVAA
jgi:hypothetical protein